MSEWIKCSDWLPARPEHISFESIPYLVSDGIRVEVICFERGHGSGNPWAEWNVYGDMHPEDITHWMQLPEPPK